MLLGTPAEQTCVSPTNGCAGVTGANGERLNRWSVPDISGGVTVAFMRGAWKGVGHVAAKLRIRHRPITDGPGHPAAIHSRPIHRDRRAAPARPRLDPG